MLTRLHFRKSVSLFFFSTQKKNSLTESAIKRHVRLTEGNLWQGALRVNNRSILGSFSSNAVGRVPECAAKSWVLVCVCYCPRASVSILLKLAHLYTLKVNQLLHLCLCVATASCFGSAVCCVLVTFFFFFKCRSWPELRNQQKIREKRIFS